jgi:parvulin-like peptidyl-prolyl isomerase
MRFPGNFHLKKYLLIFGVRVVIIIPMLKMIRQHHTKKILWGITIVIIVTFGFGSAISFLKGRQDPVVGKIAGRKIHISEVDYYDKMAKLTQTLYLLNAQMPAVESIDTQKNAGAYFMLLWKANQEKIKVRDREIVKVVRAWFSQRGKFNSEAYHRFLDYGVHMSPRIFEEYIADFIKIDTLYKTKITSKITPNEVKELFLRDTQKAKIAYIIVPVEKFNASVKPTDDDIKAFYEANKLNFKQEPKIKIAYLVVPSENEEKLKELMAKTKALNELAQTMGLPVKETDFIAMNDSINDMNWQPEVSQLAFSLEQGERSEAIKTAHGLIVLEKTAVKEAAVPSLNEIKGEITEKVKERLAMEKTQDEALELLERIKRDKIKHLKDIKLDSGTTLFESKEFRGGDYIEGIGLDLNINHIAFSLNPGEIYKELIFMPKGACIIELVNKTPFDEEKFKKTKSQYEDYLRKQKLADSEEEFLENIKKESKFEIYEQPAPRSKQK